MLRTLKRFAAVPALVALVATPALAEDTAPEADNMRVDAAWEYSERILGTVLTPEQRSLMLQLAYDTAAANVCDGLFLNRDLVEQGFAGLTHTDAGTMSEEELTYYQRHLLVNYGVQIGIMLAEFSADEAAACADVMASLNDADVPHFVELEVEEDESESTE